MKLADSDIQALRDCMKFHQEHAEAAYNMKLANQSSLYDSPPIAQVKTAAVKKHEHTHMLHIAFANAIHAVLKTQIEP